MPLSELPGDVLLCIANELDYSWDVNALALVNSSAHGTLNPYLYQFSKQYTRTEALAFGAEHGTESLVKKLLALPSNELDERTWLMVMEAAVGRGDSNIVTLFLDFGKQLHASSGWPLAFARYLDPMLWDAMCRGHEPVVRLLLQNGAAPVLTDHGKLIQYRNLWEHIPVVKLLLECARQSAVPDTVPLTTLLYYALRDPRPGIVQCFTDLRVDSSTLFGPTGGLEGLGICPDPETVRSLLDYVAGSGQVPVEAILKQLNLAIHRDSFDIAGVIVEYLDVAQALPDKIEEERLAYIAAITGSESVMLNLLQRGFRVETICADPRDIKNIPIIWAASNGQENMVRLLLRHGARVNSQCLICAIKSKSIAIATIMLDAGINANSWEGTPPNELALSLAVGQEDMFRLLFERGANVPHADGLKNILEQAVCKGRVPELQMLLDRGVSLKDVDLDLLRFAIKGGLKMLQFLYDNGYSFKQTSSESQTTTNRASPPLAECLQYGNHDAVRWLLDKGVVTIPSSAVSQYNLLQLLFKYSPDHHEAKQTLDFLLRCGVNINPRPRFAEPIVWGIAGMQSEVPLRAFLDRGAKPLPGWGERPNCLLDVANSAKHFEMMLEAILRDLPREQMGELLSGMESYAQRKEKWSFVRYLQRLQNQHGLY